MRADAEATRPTPPTGRPSVAPGNPDQRTGKPDATVRANDDTDTDTEDEAEKAGKPDKPAPTKPTTRATAPVPRTWTAGSRVRIAGTADPARQAQRALRTR